MNMAAAIAALRGCAEDLTAHPTNEGLAYYTANKLARLADELERFTARDLLTYSEAKS